MDQLVKIGRRSPSATTLKPAGQTVVERAMGIVRAGIMRGRYAPGQRLVEADLMRELGVSRGAVRDVLSRLAADGLAMIEPYRGAIVARLTREGLRSSFEVRELLEGLAARQAAERFGRRELDRTTVERNLRDYGASSSGEKDEYMERNVRFHNYIAELSGNVHLPRILTQIQVPALRSHFPNILDSAALTNSTREHFEIVRAICSGDGARAEKAMRGHVHRTAKLAELLPDYLFPAARS